MQWAKYGVPRGYRNSKFFHQETSSKLMEINCAKPLTKRRDKICIVSGLKRA